MNLENLSIRPVQQNDNPVLAELIRAVFREFNADQPGTVYTDPTTDALFELFQVDKAELWVAELEGKVAGCCGIYPTEGLPDGMVELVKFYISNEARGKGIGKHLYKQSELSAKRYGYRALYIESLPEFSKAIAIYKKLGFQLTNQRQGNSGHFNCDIWLTKQI